MKKAGGRHLEAELGDMMASTYLHPDGTHSLTFIRYGAPYVSFGMQLTAANIDALIELLEKLRAQRSEAA